jgi:mono/diheme cytochrome c family protein
MKKVSQVAMIIAIAALIAGVAMPAQAEDVAALYKAKCAVCHGADGKGSPAGQKMGVKDFHSPEVAKMTDAQLIESTTKGKGKMPAYENKLTGDQIKELVKFIRSLK